MIKIMKHLRNDEEKLTIVRGRFADVSCLSTEIGRPGDSSYHELSESPPGVQANHLLHISRPMPQAG